MEALFQSSLLNILSCNREEITQVVEDLLAYAHETDLVMLFFVGDFCLVDYVRL